MYMILALAQVGGSDVGETVNLFVQAGFAGLFAWFVLYLRRLEMENQRDWRTSQERQQAELRVFYERQTEILLNSAKIQGELYLRVTQEHVNSLHELSASIAKLSDRVERNTEATNSLVARSRGRSGSS